MTGRRALFTLACTALACTALVAGCSTGSDQVDVNNGGEFRFVAGTPAGEVIPAGERASAPDFRGTLLDGDSFDSSSLAGKVGVGDGALRQPKHWWKLRNPFRPSWGEPYVEIAARMLGAVEAARDTARGHEAVLVSHQLPIWTLRMHLEGRRYVHDPRRRECGLASVTSVTYEGDRMSGISYAEPAGATDPDAVPGA